jgi:hypothetical protein
MRMLVENDERHGADHSQHPCHQDIYSSYSDFLVTHPTLFSELIDLLEVDSWLRTIESKFGLLHCTEYQKTVCHPTTLRFCRSLVGHLHRHSSGQPPGSVDRVPCCNPWAPHSSGSHARQVVGVPAYVAGAQQHV